ncbi:MAG: tRNA modification GTPase [Bacteroidota bacterium]
MRRGNKHILISLILTTHLCSYSQVTYEKGYFLHNSGEKIECLIENLDWKNNPLSFSYKLTENSDIQKANVEEVKEFGVYDFVKYIRKTVDIDLSRDEPSNLSDTRRPIFNKKTLFFKVLLESEVSLLMYENSSLRRFFLNVTDSTYQLIFKSYQSINKTIRQNNRYKQQLANTLTCSSITAQKIENLEYKRKNLMIFFIEYFKCRDLTYVNYVKKKKRDLFNLSFRIGLNQSSLSIENKNNILTRRAVDFEDGPIFSFGIETEFLLPFHKNKWSVIIEPTYRYFITSEVISRGNVEVEYEFLEIPIGIRRYFFVNDASKFFVNGSVVNDIDMNSTIDFEQDTDLEIQSAVNFSLGVGYKRNDKFLLELRYFTGREVLTQFIDWSSSYKNFSLILGYSIF